VHAPLPPQRDGSLLKTIPITLDPFRFLIISLAGWMNEQQQYAIDYLREENRVLRAQLGHRRLRLTDDQRRSLAGKAVLLGRRLDADVATIVMPATLLNWHRTLIARKYNGTLQRGPVRPGTAKQIEGLVIRMANENRDWGYLRIQGALANLGHQVGRGTIANILRWHGIEPALTESGRRPGRRDGYLPHRPATRA
jgi:putative transposase